MGVARGEGNCGKKGKQRIEGRETAVLCEGPTSEESERPKNLFGDGVSGGGLRKK